MFPILKMGAYRQQISTRVRGSVDILAGRYALFALRLL